MEIEDGLVEQINEPRSRDPSSQDQLDQVGVSEALHALDSLLEQPSAVVQAYAFQNRHRVLLLKAGPHKQFAALQKVTYQRQPGIRDHTDHKGKDLQDVRGRAVRLRACEGRNSAH